MKQIILILCMFFTFSSRAETSGSCGATENDICNWSLDDSGKLTITGSGNMKDYTYNGDDDAPWGKNISSLSISGITSIGAYAFQNAQNLTTVEIPSSVTTVGHDAFIYSGLTNVTLNEGLKSINPWSFGQLPSLTQISIPQSVTSISYNAFAVSGITEIVLSDNLLENGFLSEAALSGIQQIFCSKKNAQKCTDWLETALNYQASGLSAPLKDIATIKVFEESSNGQIFYNNKWYNNPNDILSGDYIKKRIYTIEEATKVSKPTGNTVRIKYR